MLMYRIIFLSGELTRSLEVDAQVGVVTFIVFADILDRVNMEGNGKAMHRKDDGLGFAVHKYLQKQSQHTSQVYCTRLITHP